MKRLSFAVTIGIALALGGIAMSQDKALVVTPGISPISYEQDGKIIGIGTDIIVELFKRIKLQYDIKVVPSARAMSMVQDGEADFIFAVAKTPEREGFMFFTADSFVDQPISLYVRTDSKISYDGDLKKIAQARIGIIRGGRLSPDFEEAIKNKAFQNITEVAEYKQSILLLDSNRIDIAIGPRLSILFAAKEAGKQAIIKELEPPITPSSPAYLGISKKGKYAAYVDKINAALAAMRKDGTYDAVLKKYLK